MTSSHSIKASLFAASARLITEEASYEAQLLLQAVLGVNRAWLIAHANDVLETSQHIAFEALLHRRIKGEPMAYILGHREFYGLDLLVTADTLIPRPDTETLVEAVLAKIPQSATLQNKTLQKNTSKNPSFRRKSESSGVEQYSQTPLDSDFRRNDGMNVLDLGTGTGAIALAIAKNRPEVFVTAVDSSIGALEVAKNNATNLGIMNVEFVLSYWFDALIDENNACDKFDVIVSNPPYIEQNDIHLTQGDLRFEPISALASGEDGLADIRQIINNCLIHLKPQGWLMLEHGYNQAELVADLMAETGLTGVATLKDLGGNNRVTIGKNPLIVSTHWD